MSTRKPISTLIPIILTLLFLLSFFIAVLAFDSPANESDDDDLQGFAELVALDHEEEQQQDLQESHAKTSELLSKAQRIVLELNNENTKRIIEENEFVLVLGYAPWCARSAELMPRFAEAANFLKESGSQVKMAKIDAERYPKMGSFLEIKGFPTLLLFVNGSSHVYTGGFSAVDVVIWAKKKTGQPVARISSVEEAEEFVEKYHIFVIGLFPKFEGSDYENFVKSAISDNEIQFVEVSDIELAKVLFPHINPTDHFIGLVKSEPERYITYEGAYEMDRILQFLDYNKFPLVTKLDEINSVRVYSSPIKLQVMVFAEADEFKKLLEPLQDVALKFMSKIMILYIDITDENLAKPFLSMFGLEDSEDTVVTAFDNRRSRKFLLESTHTPNNIEEFCSGLLHGTLSPYFKSQAIPDNEGKTVQVVVGKTFDELVLHTPKNVLLEVHTPWCISCETTSKKIEKLAKHFKGLDNLVFSRIDASINEHPDLQIDDYPTLLFYPADDKANPIKLSTKSSSKDMAAFVNKHLRPKGQVTNDEL